MLLLKDTLPENDALAPKCLCAQMFASKCLALSCLHRNAGFRSRNGSLESEKLEKNDRYILFLVPAD